MQTAAILYNPVAAQAAEDDLDTLVQVEAIAEALARLGVETARIEFELDWRSLPQKLGSPAGCKVFNLVETVEGSGRCSYLAASFLDLNGYSYTGCRAAALLVCADKVLTKQIITAAGLPTSPWSLPEEVRTRFAPDETLILKSIFEDASIGIESDSLFQAGDSERLQKALDRRRGFKGSWFVERYIEGREFNVSVIEKESGPEVLPLAEMVFSSASPVEQRFLSYESKWDHNSPAYGHSTRSFDPNPGDDELRSRLAELSLRCWEIFDLHGYARVDFRVTPEGQPIILEINPNPCIAPDSGFAAALTRAGISFEQAIEMIFAAGF